MQFFCHLIYNAIIVSLWAFIACIFFKETDEVLEGVTKKETWVTILTVALFCTLFTYKPVRAEGIAEATTAVANVIGKGLDFAEQEIDNSRMIRYGSDKNEKKNLQKLLKRCKQLENMIQEITRTAIDESYCRNSALQFINEKETDELQELLIELSSLPPGAYPFPGNRCKNVYLMRDRNKLKDSKHPLLHDLSSLVNNLCTLPLPKATDREFVKQMPRKHISKIVMINLVIRNSCKE